MDGGFHSRHGGDLGDLGGRARVLAVDDSRCRRSCADAWLSAPRSTCSRGSMPKDYIPDLTDGGFVHEPANAAGCNGRMAGALGQSGFAGGRWEITPTSKAARQVKYMIPLLSHGVADLVAVRYEQGSQC